MERTGMRFYSQEAIDLFKKAGASISDDNLVRISSQLVDKALDTVPKQIIIYDRLGAQAMTLGAQNTYFGVGSDCMNVWDIYTNKRRKALHQDLINGIRVADYLSNIDFIMSMYIPSDIDQQIYDRYQMQAMLLESKKPVVLINNDLQGLKDCVEMAKIVAGGLKKLEKKPFVICYANATSPTKHNKEAVEKLLYCAEHNLPIIYIPGNHWGVTSPITPAGALALGNAGQLGALVLSQLKQEGAPFIIGDSSGSVLDMKTMSSCYVAPDPGPFDWDMAHYYGLPAFGIGGCSNSKMFDSQAAAEAALSIFAGALSRVDLIHDVGYLDCGMNFSLELLVFCDEIIEWVKRYLRKLEITKETLPLELIEKIGVDGNFLETEHTLRHYKERWRPELINRQSYERWNADGSLSLEKRTNKKVKEIIETYQNKQLPDSIIRQIKNITARAKERLSN